MPQPSASTTPSDNAAGAQGAVRGGKLLRLLLALLLAAAGADMGIGGLALLQMGGSAYYIMTGAALLVVAVLIMLRSMAALPIYALVVFATLVWAVAEVGLDWWQLAPRGGLLVLFGILLLVRPVRRRMEHGEGRKFVALPLQAAIVASVGIAIAAWIAGPQTVDGELPQASYANAGNSGEWTAYGGDAAGQHWSALAQITPANIARLKPVWHYHTGDLPRPGDPLSVTNQVTPLKIGQALFLCTPHALAIALDAETGRELWRFDPQAAISARAPFLTCRGLSYLPPEQPGDTAPCAARLFLPTPDARLFALDAKSGKPCAGFGRNGAVDLALGMGGMQPGIYYSTSPPVDLDWIVGAIYFQESGVEDTVSDQQFFGGNPFPFARDSTDYKSISRGLFTQLNYRVTSELRITGGIRYTWDSRNAVRHGRNGSVLPDFSDSACAVVAGFVPTATMRDPAGGCNDARGGNFSYPAWLASVDYQVSPVTFVYLKTSGASLAGGINFRATAPGLESISPEAVRDVEAGIKSDLFDRHVRLNLSAFHIWRSALQANVNPIINGRTTQFQINAGDARQYGGELETTILPWQGMELTGNVAYLHSRYVPGSFLAPTGVPATPFYDRSGETVTQAPEWTWSIGATQKVDVPNGRLSLHADYSYISTFAFYANSFNPTNPALTPAIITRLNDLGLVKGHSNLNARITYNLEQPDIEIAVWGQNLTQVKYYDAPFTGLYQSVGIATSSVNAPRTYGVSATYRF